MRDEVKPDGPWEFDDDVAAAFDDMLERSIPDYRKMREAVNAIAIPALALGVDPVRVHSVLDAGCSNGLALKSIDDYAVEHGHTIDRLVGVDVSEPMLERARGVGDDRYQIMHHDLREHLPFDNDAFDVVLCVLTLQFTPIIHRNRIIDEFHRVLRPGGRLVLVEKIIGATKQLDQDMVGIYHDHKRQMGYSEEQIERKRLSLEGVLDPLLAWWNENMVRTAGFVEVDCFWRWMNFAGWVGIKE